MIQQGAVSTNGSPLLTAEQYAMVGIYCSVYKHSHTEVYLGHFQFETLTDKTAMNNDGQVLA